MGGFGTGWFFSTAPVLLLSLATYLATLSRPTSSSLRLILRYKLKVTWPETLSIGTTTCPGPWECTVCPLMKPGHESRYCVGRDNTTPRSENITQGEEPHRHPPRAPRPLRVYAQPPPAPFHTSSNLETHQAPFEQPGPCRTVSDKAADLPLHAARSTSIGFSCAPVQ